ncbi:MAG TPA: NADP oxidoreductase [Desulfobacteraceae bacterium]|nr:NADP oxidoreductase [Desulfobacteraceae bacterium]
MAKLTVQDLKKIKEDATKSIYLRGEKGNIRVIIHMGTCGIAAGAREVMTALMEEMARDDYSHIRVMASGCMGLCSSEPNVTVEIEEQSPIVYQHVNANKMRQIFKRHVLMGEVQTDFALAKM